MAKKKPARFKCTDARGNVAYIHHEGGRWVCTLSNGINAAFSYAIGHCPDEQGLRFALDDAMNDSARAKLLRERAGRGVQVEVM